MASAIAPPSRLTHESRILFFIKDVEVSDGNTTMLMQEKRTFLANVRLQNISEERYSERRGPYRSLWVATPDGRTTYVLAFGELRFAAEKLTINRIYSFEGYERIAPGASNNQNGNRRNGWNNNQSNNNRRGNLTRYLRLIRIVNAPLTVMDASIQDETSLMPEEESHPL